MNQISNFSNNFDQKTWTQYQEVLGGKMFWCVGLLPTFTSVYCMCKRKLHPPQLHLASVLYTKRQLVGVFYVVRR